MCVAAVVCRRHVLSGLTTLLLLLILKAGIPPLEVLAPERPRWLFGEVTSSAAVKGQGLLVTFKLV